LFLFWRHDVAVTKVRENLEQNYVHKDSLVKYKDLYNQAHFAIKTQSITNDAAMIVYRNLLDSQNKEIGITEKQRDYYVGLVATKHGVKIIPIHDTVKIPFGYTYSDENYSIYHDTLTVPFTDSIGLNINRYWKKPWPFGLKWKKPFPLADKRWFLDVGSADTAVKITSLKEVNIDNDLSRWGIAATGGLTLPNLRPAVMIGVSYNIFRFGKHGHK